MARRATWGVLIAAALLAGCSAMQLTYNQADVLLSWRADSYFDFDAQQKQEFHRRLERLLVWHRREQLPDPSTFDQPETELRPQFASDWPCFANAKWFPALGDGAANSLGSGCITRQRASLMVGTTGAMRVVVEAPSIEIPRGLWCYRVDRKRFVLGGALSNGGEVYAWAKRTLQFPKDLEARLESAMPGTHGLTVMSVTGSRAPPAREARCARSSSCQK